MSVVRARPNRSEFFTLRNPILRLAEIGLELDTGKFKMGDGHSYWNDLSYVGGNGGSQPVVTVVDEVLFSDIIPGEGEFPSWPGVAPFREIAANQIVFACTIIVMEVFNDSGIGSEIQVTNDPEGESTQLSNAPNPTTLGHSNGAVWDIETAADDAPGDGRAYLPKAGPLTPVVGFSEGFNDDGTTGRALIFTTFYTPPS